jgi:hypothetical protein
MVAMKAQGLSVIAFAQAAADRIRLYHRVNT